MVIRQITDLDKKIPQILNLQFCDSGSLLRTIAQSLPAYGGEDSDGGYAPKSREKNQKSW